MVRPVWSKAMNQFSLRDFFILFKLRFIIEALQGAVWIDLPFHLVGMRVLHFFGAISAGFLNSDADSGRQFPAHQFWEKTLE